MKLRNARILISLVWILASCQNNKRAGNLPQNITIHRQAFAYGFCPDAAPLFQWGNTGVSVDTDIKDFPCTLVANFPDKSPGAILAYSVTHFGSGAAHTPDSATVTFENDYLHGQEGTHLSCTMMIRMIKAPKGVNVRVSSDASDDSDALGMDEGALTLIRIEAK
jgi:hypothetical protein